VAPRTCSAFCSPTSPRTNRAGLAREHCVPGDRGRAALDRPGTGVAQPARAAVEIDEADHPWLASCRSTSDTDQRGRAGLPPATTRPSSPATAMGALPCRLTTAADVAPLLDLADAARNP
jgi:hypothetical protein